MPRPAKGTRLWFDKAAGLWYIRDGTSKRGTGASLEERQTAEAALATYLAEKYRPPETSVSSRLPVAVVLAYYYREIASNHRTLATRSALAALNGWWGDKNLSDVKRSTCQAYVVHRTGQRLVHAKTPEARERRIKPATAGRELTVLRAAIRAYHAETPLDALPIVTTPPPAQARTRWLMLGFTREEGYMACSAFWFDMSCRAAPEEYRDLAAYLAAKGNILDIRHRLSPAMSRTRERQYAAQEAEAAQAAQLPSEALLACLRAAGITSQVTGVAQASIIEEASQTATAQPARWIAMYLAKNSFSVTVREIAWAYGRSVPGVERLVRRVEDMRRTNRNFAAVMDRMESLALAERLANGDAFEIAA